ncbi:MAG: PQQ-binding-like beta-propeller repeat protein [Ktedonobacteraceae bacterium]
MDRWKSPLVASRGGGVVYVGSFDGMLYAFSAAGCQKATCDALYASPAVANGVVYIASLDHRVYAYHLPGTVP